MTNVNDAPACERATVVDARSDAAAVAQIGDAHHGSKRQRAVGNAAMAMIPRRNTSLRVRRCGECAKRNREHDRVFIAVPPNLADATRHGGDRSARPQAFAALSRENERIATLRKRNGNATGAQESAIDCGK